VKAFVVHAVDTRLLLRIVGGGAVLTQPSVTLWSYSEKLSKNAQTQQSRVQRILW